MESEKVQKIKKILFWMDELTTIQIYREYCNYSNNIFYAKPRLRFISKHYGFENEIELSEWSKAIFSEWLDDQAKHIQGLIDEADEELVEIAKAIDSGEMKL